LANLGFDARTANVDVLSYLNVEERFLPAAGVRWEHLDPAVQACIRAEAFCTGYVFHPGRTASKRLGRFLPDVLGFERITRSTRWSADVILLVMDGRVVHRSFPAIRAPRIWTTAANPWVPCRIWAARWHGPPEAHLLIRSLAGTLRYRPRRRSAY